MGKFATRRLLLLRSLPTAWDVAMRLQGQNDLPPAEADASDAARPAIATGVDALTSVLSGTDEASRLTAAGFASVLGGKVHIDDNLRDLDVGLWAGLTLDELEERFERAGGQWLDDPASVTLPSGENLSTLEQRILPVLFKAVCKRRGGIALGVVLRPVAYALVRCRLEDLPTTRMKDYLFETVSPCWFDLTPADPRLLPRTDEPVTLSTQASAV